ncbi:MAG TPA: NAD-dependent epimerase/dehydratase family protein [Phenylobacterium sp.]|nr:NAD-dependent epimerase/dehydratase family protein [Phenylobacterium sp.]
MTRRAVIIGGSGQIGRAVAANLLDHGWSVVCAQRHPDDLPAELRGRVDVVALDRNEESPARAVGQGADLLVDTVAFTAAHAAQLLELAGDVGALSVISTGSVYADAAGRTLDEARETGFPQYPVPIREDQPRTAPGPATYSTHKVALEDALLDAWPRDLTILRPGAIYGPGCRSPREWWALQRLLDGRAKIPLAYGGASRFHTSATANVAELVRIAAGQPGVRVLNAVDPEALSVAELVRAIMRATGRSAELLLIPGPPEGLFGMSPWSIPGPVVLDMAAAEALGYAPVTDYAGFVGETCRDLIGRAEGRPWREAFPGLAPYPAAMFDYQAEDAAFEVLHG